MLLQTLEVKQSCISAQITHPLLYFARLAECRVLGLRIARPVSSGRVWLGAPCPVALGLRARVCVWCLVPV